MLLRPQVLPEEELSAALHKYVDKDEKEALAACLEAALLETHKVGMKVKAFSCVCGDVCCGLRWGVQ